MEPPTNTNDATGDERVRAAQTGNEQAFAHLFVPYPERCVNRAALVLGGWNDAEDDVHTAFCQVYRSLPGFQRKPKLRTGLLRIVVNECQMRIRTARRRCSLGFANVVTGSNASPTDPPDMRPDQEAEIGRQELAALVSAEVQLVPETLRSPLVLRYFEQYTLVEIAQALVLIVAAAKSCLSRARQVLRKRLERVNPTTFRKRPTRETVFRKQW
jgi:RNA polymerase sigma-70 factor (ECF subfamily)